MLGKDRVFLDCESIPAGADFVEELLARVRSARVLLAVIGPRWLTATDADGRQRRIDNPDDWIHREIAEAFIAGIRIVPANISATTSSTCPRRSEDTGATAIPTGIWPIPYDADNPNLRMTCASSRSVLSDSTAPTSSSVINDWPMGSLT